MFPGKTGLLNQSAIISFLLGLALLPAPIGNAQPLGRDVLSAEWIVANSSTIVIGTVEGYELDHPKTWKQSGKVKLKVSRTLKGRHIETLNVSARMYSLKQKLDKWKRNKTEVIAFARQKKALEKQPLSLQMDWSFGDNTIFPNSPDFKASKLHRANSELLKDYSDLIECTESAIAFEKKHKPWPAWRPHPIKLDTKVYPYGPWVTMFVPADSRLESIAKQWLVSGTKFQKQQATHMLLRFRSRANLAFVRKARQKISDPEVQDNCRELIRYWTQIKDSFEWMAADSPLIVLGTIDRYDPSNPSNDEMTITMKVKETLQGKHQDRISFKMFFSDSTRIERKEIDFKWLKSNQKEVLVFLVHQNQETYDRSSPTYAVREYAMEMPAAFFVESHYSHHIHNMDLNWPRKTLLARTRQAIADAKRLRPERSILIRFTPWTHSRTELRVPVDSRLEALAKKMVQSKLQWQILIGVELLRIFPSKANTTFLEKIKSASPKNRFITSAIDRCTRDWRRDEKQPTDKLVKTAFDYWTYRTSPLQMINLCVALGDRGAEAKKAIPILESCSTCTDRDLRHAARAALAKIKLAVSQVQEK